MRKNNDLMDVMPEYSEDAFTPNLKDMVNNPPHYNQHGIECLDAIQAATGEGYQYYLQENICGDIDIRMEKRIYKKHYFIYKE